MTRFIHDQFAKDYLEELLKPYGEVNAPYRVVGEARAIDVFFSPFIAENPQLEVLGLLGQFAKIPAILEPFRNPATEKEIRSCLLKELEIISVLEKEAKRNETTLTEAELPKLWILTPTVSAERLSRFNAVPLSNSLPGMYYLGEALRTAIVAIHQLPKTHETLWLRLLGRGRVQKLAINELTGLSKTHPYRQVTLELLYNLQQNLRIIQSTEPDDRELLMRLAPLYQQDKEQAKQEARQEGIQDIILQLLGYKFGELDASVVEQVQALSEEKLAALGKSMLNFSEVSLLEAWLMENRQAATDN